MAPRHSFPIIFFAAFLSDAPATIAQFGVTPRLVRNLGEKISRHRGKGATPTSNASRAVTQDRQNDALQKKTPRGIDRGAFGVSGFAPTRWR
jgi:hypothetical protein